MCVAAGGVGLPDSGVAVADPDGLLLPNGVRELDEPPVLFGGAECVGHHPSSSYVRSRGRRDGGAVAGQLGACGGGDAVVEVSAQLSASGAACGLHVAEAHAEIRVGFVDGDADEGVVVVDADLGDVAWVVANGDAPADKRGKRRGEVSLALEVDPVRCTVRLFGTVSRSPSSSTRLSGIRGSHPSPTHAVRGVTPSSLCGRSL